MIKSNLHDYRDLPVTNMAATAVASNDLTKTVILKLYI